MAEDTGQAGAQSEITDAMVDAGVQAHERWRRAADVEFMVREMVKAIVSHMTRGSQAKSR